MTQGLPVSRLINVSVLLAPTAAQVPNLNSAIIIGDSNVIDTVERYRSYGTLAGVAVDFGTVAPEYTAAALFFGQTPQPNQLYIGRWASAATAGMLKGGALSAVQQNIATWNAVVAGNLKVSIDGSAVTNVVCGTFAAAANLNAVAAIIQVAVRAVGGGGFALATVVWDGTRFIITSGTTGAASAVSALTAGNANDISAMMLGTAATLQRLIPGLAAGETPVQAYVILDNLNFYFYASLFAATANINDAAYTAVAAYVQGSNNKHVLGVTSSEVGIITAGDNTSIAFALKALGYSRTFVQYSSVNPYAAASWIGRAVTVNFAGSLTVINMMYQQEPGVIGESLTTTQADAALSVNANVFVNYNNNTMIVQYGTMANGTFFDDLYNTDWLALQIQTNVYNLLYTATTKIPQTDPGNQRIYNAIEAACVQGVNNGTLAPGQWNGPNVGQLITGQYVPKGYYIYQPPVASQSTADRQARKSVVFQVAAKLAGAVNTVNVIVNVDR